MKVAQLGRGSRKREPFPYNFNRYTRNLGQALRKCSNTSAPGPDQVPYGIWKGINSVNRKIIAVVVNHLLRRSIHPPSLKDSLGILLPKPAKGDWDTFASYRVSARMQKFSKIAKRIIN